jgi:hypothetical protein
VKVAWFTPVGRDDPEAEYSRAVLAAMAQLCEVLLCCDPPPDGFPPGVRVLDLVTGPVGQPELGSVDAIFYVLGNDAEQHAWIFEMSRDHPGIVVLRDPTLHRFFLDYYLGRLRRPDLYVTRMADHYGVKGLAAAQLVLEPWFDGGEARIEERDLLRYTFAEEALRSASGAVIHSGLLEAVVPGRWNGPVCAEPLPAGLFTSPVVARDYARGLLAFAEQRVPRPGARSADDEASRDLAERIAGGIGETLASLGASPDMPGVGAVIREVSRILWPPSG